MSGARRTRGNQVLRDITYGVGRTVDGVTGVITAPFTDPVIRLGVTGLSRAGKTVFITSLVANLLNRGRMPQLAAVASGELMDVMSRPTSHTHTHTYKRVSPDCFFLLSRLFRHNFFQSIPS